MNDNVTTFLANLRHDIRNNQSVEVGSGVFKGQELVDVANALDATNDLLTALERLEGVAIRFVSHSARMGACKDIFAQTRTAIAKAKGD